MEETKKMFRFLDIILNNKMTRKLCWYSLLPKMAIVYQMLYMDFRRYRLIIAHSVPWYRNYNIFCSKSQWENIMLWYTFDMCKFTSHQFWSAGNSRININITFSISNNIIIFLQRGYISLWWCIWTIENNKIIFI